jgi:predicted hotdog family 3-hydroxylacyl-ACP dehydratase
MIDIASLLPHRGAAIMIERVLHWDDTKIVVATTLHRSPTNPLRRKGRLAAVHLAEFGAQAMAIHGGLKDRVANRVPLPALLVAVRDLVVTRDYIDDLSGELEIAASMLSANRGSWQYSFSVTHGNKAMATGRVAAMAYAIQST